MATFALVDCNNFYASCERLFRPNLKSLPVVVLSNNDGCVIARSQEAKTIGIGMGAPLFKIRTLVEEHGVAVCSSNYALYGDISERVMTMLGSNAPSHEVYSIDECFLDLDNLGVPDLTAWCSSLRRDTYQWTGIPVSIGVGGTKTLAKLANRLAKKSTKAGGVIDLAHHPEWIDAALRKTPIGDVWGVGRRWSQMLEERGMVTAHDFAHAQDGWIRQKMGVVGQCRFSSELTHSTQMPRRNRCLDLSALPSSHRTPGQSLALRPVSWSAFGAMAMHGRRLEFCCSTCPPKVLLRHPCLMSSPIWMMG